MEENKELIFKLNTLEQNIQQLQQQIQAIEYAINDLSILDLGLDDLIGKKDSEILAPLGKGILVKTKLISEILLVDVGGKNFVKKSILETKELIKEQIKKIEVIKSELEDNLEIANKELSEIIDRPKE